ncbi:MAG: RsmE family RNA methyltransferase [Ilumatobacteraceae bacterium]
MSDRSIVVDDGLRRSTAHVRVDDVGAPEVDEATGRHLWRVLRVRDGAAVSITDGAGRWRTCRVAGSALEPTGEIVSVAPPATTVTVCAAVPKGERADWLVQKCSEVGVDRIVIVIAERSVVRWAEARVDRQLERLRRVAVEAALQSRRVWFPAIDGPVSAADVLPEAAVAEPGGRALRLGDAMVAVGPEGGWSPAELAAAADLVSLGPNVLRVETAAVVAAATMVAMRDSVLR